MLDKCTQEGNLHHTTDSMPQIMSEPPIDSVALPQVKIMRPLNTDTHLKLTLALAHTI